MRRPFPDAEFGRVEVRPVTGEGELEEGGRRAANVPL
jgi:hypothetical protein